MEMWGKYLAGSGMEHCSKMQIKSVWWREVQMVPVCWQSMQMRQQHGGKVFRYSDETAEAVASGEKLLKESGTIYESFADMMSPEDAKRYLDFLERWKQRRIDRCRAGRSGNGRYNMEVLQEDRIMYRAGNVQNPYGRWFTSEDIMLCKLI